MPARRLPPVCRRRPMPARASSTCRWAGAPPRQLCAPLPGNWPVPAAYWCSRLAMKVCPRRRVLPINSSPSAKPPPSWSARSTPAMKLPASPTAPECWHQTIWWRQGWSCAASTRMAPPSFTAARPWRRQSSPARRRCWRRRSRRSRARRLWTYCCVPPTIWARAALTRFMAAACSTSPVPSSRWAPAALAGNPWRSPPAVHSARPWAMAGRSPMRWPVW